jgi:hypothetical protein
MEKTNNIKYVALQQGMNLQTKFNIYPKNICLITGAPRSGTSALCDWLGTQREVSSFPESRILVSANKFIEEAYRFQNPDKRIIDNLIKRLILNYYSKSRMLIGKKLLVDKEPLEPIAFPLKNYADFIGNIKKILPDIKILFAIRDPFATIWSMSRRTWGESLTNMESIKFSIKDYVDNWCSCVDIAVQYRSDPQTYTVQFGRLIKDSENESKKIFEFLNIRNGIIFQPRITKENNFAEEDKKAIMVQVKPYLEKLKSIGITDLS